MVTVNMMMCRPSSFFLFWLSFSHTSPKYMIGSAQICSGTHWLLRGSWIVVLGSLTSFSLLEQIIFLGEKPVCENTKFRISCRWNWGRLPRAVVATLGSLEMSQGKVEQSLEQPGIVEGASGRRDPFGCCGFQLFHLPPSPSWPCSISPPLGPILPQWQVPLDLIERLSGHGWLILPHYSSSPWIWEPLPLCFT